MTSTDTRDLRQDTIERAQQLLDTGEYQRHLAELVAVETESQNPDRHDDLHAYLTEIVTPMLSAMGFECETYPNPVDGGGPFLVGERHEGDDLPTVLTYGHGDVVVGMANRWTDPLQPYAMTETDDRLYGRGTADNKGQHLINWLALKTVLEARDGVLGYNLKVLVETSEEIGSVGLRQFVDAHGELLSADVLIASDGPRVAPATPTIVLGTRGAMSFNLVVDLRTEAHHSGNWGGFIADPAIVLAHAIATISSSTGRINVPEWRPEALDDSMRTALAGCPFDAGESGDEPDDWWGEPGLTLWERTSLWPSFSVLAIEHGNPAKPVNAIWPRAVAYCGLRYPASLDPDTVLPALRRFLDERGFERVEIDGGHHPRMGATCGHPDSPWASFAKDSIARSIGRAPQVLPAMGGSLPNDVFTDGLGIETVWVPHSYNSCGQHAADEHILKPVVGEALAMMAGLWWDLGDQAAPLGQ